MVVIKQGSVEPTEEKKTQTHTFEKVEEAKAKLFHAKKDAFRILGIRRHLMLGFLLLAAFGSLAFLPLLRTVSDIHAIVVPANLVHIEALKYGKIEEVGVSEGDHVKAGQVLARIVSPEDDKMIRETQSEMSLIRAQLKGLEANRIYEFERLETDGRLFEKRVISHDELKKSELAFKKLEQDREVLRARLAWLEEKLGFLRDEKKRGVVKAPVSGKIISDVRAKEGTFVNKGEFMLTLASRESRLEFLLREEDYGRVRIGDPARVRFYAFPYQSFLGEVVKVKHYAESVDKHGFNTTAIKVLIKLKNMPDGLRGGMSARVKIRARAVSLVDAVRRRI